MSRTYEQKVPAGTRWIMSRKDLPLAIKPAVYLVTDAEGHTRQVRLEKRKRQVLEALTLGPVYCASTVRVGDGINRLREEEQIGIKTLWFHDKTGPIASQFGVYVLVDRVELLENSVEEAA